MKRAFLGMALFGSLFMVVGPIARAQDKITYRDSTKGSKEVEASGAIQSESPNNIVVKPTIGPVKTIPASDIVDVVYEVKGISKELNRAVTAERAAKGGKAGLTTALKEYQSLQGKITGNVPADRHLQYKIASLTAKIAGDDPAQMKQAIPLLVAFKKNHANGWQINGCIALLSQLYMDTGSFEQAAAAFDDLMKVPGLSEEGKADAEMKAADCLMRAKKYEQAAERLQARLSKTPKNKPEYESLEMKLISCKATTPAKFKEAVDDLRKKIAASKDPAKIALFYNALGDCYSMNNEPKAAMYEYLFVDLIYNGDKSQHKKAVEQLAQVFKELKQMDKAKEYADKADRLK
jgi:tetratricopeptide (TPR) repeat protein